MDGFSDSWYDHLQKNQCSDFFTCKNHSLEWQNWLKLLNIVTLSRLENEIQHQTLLRYIYNIPDRWLSQYRVLQHIHGALKSTWLVTMPAYSDFVKSLPSSCLKLWVYSCVHHHQEGTCSSSTVHLCQVYWIKRWVENEVMSMLTMLEDRPILHHSQCLCIPVLCTDCNLIARQLTDFLSLPCTASPSSGCKDVSLAQYMFSSMPTVAQSLDSLL